MNEPLFRAGYYKQRDGTLVVYRDWMTASDKSSPWPGKAVGMVSDLAGNKRGGRFADTGRYVHGGAYDGSDLLPGECDKDGNPIAASLVSLAQGGELPDAEGWYPAGSKPREAGIVQTREAGGRAPYHLMFQSWNGMYWGLSSGNSRDYAELNAHVTGTINPDPHWRPLPAEQEESSLTGWTERLLDPSVHPASAAASTAPQTSAVHIGMDFGTDEMASFAYIDSNGGVWSVHVGPAGDRTTEAIDPSAKPHDTRPLTAKEQAWKDEQAKKLIAPEPFAPAPFAPGFLMPDSPRALSDLAGWTVKKGGSDV